MWMVGYNHNSKSVDDDDAHRFSFGGRRKLIEATTSSSSHNINNATSFFSTAPLHASNIFPINHHFDQHGKSHHHQREYTTLNNTQSVVQSTRWNPTPEQLMTLEDLYQRGTRTPSAEQIQHITAQLRRYGKIEGKNVFYWFQNHKARERQKRRRQQIESESEPQHDQHVADHDIRHGASKTEVFKVEETMKKCPVITRFAEHQELVSLRRGGDEIGWVQELEQQQQHTTTTSMKNGTWQMMQLSCPLLSNDNITSMDPSSSSHHHDDLNTSITVEKKKKKKKKKNANYYTTTGPQTLQLFPLETIHAHHRAINQEFISTPPFQFFEFLPPKP